MRLRLPTAGNTSGICPECGRTLAGQKLVPDPSRLLIFIPMAMAAVVHALVFRRAMRVAYQVETAGDSFPPGGYPWPEEVMAHRPCIASLCVLAWAVYAIVIWCRSARRHR